MDIRKCECCGRENGEVKVACSALGAVSIAYCFDCGIEGAEPLYLLDTVYKGLGGKVAPWMMEVKYWDEELKTYSAYRDSFFRDM